MQYCISNQYGQIIVDNLEKADIEKTLRSKLSPETNFFMVNSRLPIPLTATVLRNTRHENEMVKLESNGRHVDLKRDVGHQGGDIGVSCDPDGLEVPVNSINIEFRSYDDDLTDRGLVWIIPGNISSFCFSLKVKALESPGKTLEIVEEAEQAVEAKLLNHFRT